MLVPIVEPRPMAKAGRPKKDLPAMTMVRIGKETNQLAREAGAHYGETISAYVDRVVRERAQSDLDAIAKKRANRGETGDSKSEGAGA